MSKPLPDILSYEWGWAAFREDALQLIAWGYQLVESQIRQSHEEEDITGLIRQGINIKLDTLDDPLWLQFMKYFVANEDPVDDDTTRGKRRRFVDILS